MKGGDIIIECLKAQGVRCIFGMPGTQNLHIYDSLLRCGEGLINHYLVRHEFAATKMADGFSRSTGEVGVALTVPGPGASNASTGILEAFTDCVPVLLITGQHELRFYEKDSSKMFHGLDQMKFFEPITKYRGKAGSVEEIPILIENAFKAMLNGRPGPAVLEFPMDIVKGNGNLFVPGKVRRSIGRCPSSKDVSSVAGKINSFRSPIFVVGSSVIHSNAKKELKELIEKIQAPVAVTRCAKGVFDENHKLSLRGTNGVMFRQAAEFADATVAIGCRFTSLDTENWKLQLPQPIVQIDEDANEIGREYPCEASLVGGLKSTLTALTEEIEQGKACWKQPLEKIRAEFFKQRPLPLLDEIRQVLPAESILCVDVHSLGYSTFDEYPVDQPRNYLYPCIGVSLGYAYPASIGAKIGCPDKPVVCFSGDGGFLMGSSEIATAVKYGVNVIGIVINDGALTSIKASQQKAFRGRTIDTNMINPDFVELAKSFGAKGKRVKSLDKFKKVLEEALVNQGPTIIEVLMEDNETQLVDSINWLKSNPLRSPLES
mgnify:CR=1 FL=1